MKLKEIHRTSTFAWSPSPSLPLLATGTVAGALDESFSNNGQLEIWAPDFLDRNQFDLGGEGQAGPKASVTTTSRFNRLAWGYVNSERPRGVIVAGMENGELDIWDPAKILANADPSESLILRNKTHTGPVRGLDFNPIQTNLFSSGAVNGEIYVWDLKDPSKPYSPGTRSTKLDEITALAWNHHVQYALAASSSTGYTVVWDLRGKREVAALAYGGGAGTLAGGMQGYGAPGFAMGGRRGMSDVAWHPDNATRLVTSSEDDASPVIMVWDLRNARAPEKILTGHEKGVLSLSWNKQDSDLLLSCGKDNRALCWNPQTSEIIGELPSADNWAFQVQWCPRNPDLFAAAFFDGTIGIHSIQSTNEGAETPAAAPQADASDIFGAPGFSRASQATLSLKHPPKWLRRPTSNSFGYGGKLVTVSNLPSAQGKNQSSVVHVRKVVTEDTIVERAQKLLSSTEADNLKDLAEEKTGAEASATWRALLSLFKANSRDELITLLGFSKEEVASRVAEAVANLKKAKASVPVEQDVTETDIKAHEPVVSFAEPEREATPEDKGEEGGEDTLDSASLAAEATPSEVSASGASDTTSTTRQADGESTTTNAPSLFGDDNLIGTPQGDAAADFFGSIGTARTAEDDNIQVPHHNYPLDSSVAATIGSRPSSVASEVLKDNTFRIYPNDESETDRLVTKALVLGDFESAVSLCLSCDRFADAILLAVKGGPELLARTQKAYFERRTTQLPYLRLFQSIVTNDLDDIVQNADLQEWQEIFVVLCTFASQEEFSGLAEQLGQRLEFQSNIVKASGAPDAESKAAELRRNATLTYLAAGRLERLVNIWIEELAEDEKRLVAEAEKQERVDGSLYTAHAIALQTFIEKVTVFRKAINYVDDDLNVKAAVDDSTVRTYKLSGLYDRYFEYADLLAAQGLVKEAVSFLKLVPPEYNGAAGSPYDFTVGRDRLLKAASEAPVRTTSLAATGPAVPSKAAPVASTSNAYAYGHYAPVAQQPISQSTTASSVYEPYAPAIQPVASHSSNPYAPPAPAVQPAQPYQAAAPGPYNPYSRAPAQAQNVAPPQPSVLPPPPRAANATPSVPPLAPPPQGPPIKRDNGGWNDAPAVAQRRTPANANAPKPGVITSPFPNAPSPTSTLPYGQQPPTTLPPPPRPGSVQQRPPPPPQGQRGPPPPGAAGPGPYPPHARPPSGPPGPPPQQHIAPPPQRMPPGPPQGPPGPGMVRPPPQGPYGAPQGVPVPGQTPPPPPHGHAPYAPPPGPGGPQGPPGPYARATPPPGFARAMSPQGTQAPGPYAPPPQAQPQFAPPQPGAPLAGQPMAGPPPGAAAPPPGPPRGSTPAGSSAPAPPRAKPGPPPPKYPPGDRSHIPDELRPIYQVISSQLEQLRQVTPPQQKRLVDDLERRINPLFDALNCETLSKPVCEQLLMLTRAMEAHDREAAMAIHMDLLTRGSLTDDIGLWMSGIKQLIVRL
ncbi:WD40 repeat-like protein [Trametes cingulata]|nr:WD40 repeat-like protein [Trametes cingulata]